MSTEKPLAGDLGIQHEENGHTEGKWKEEKYDGKGLQEEAAEVFIDEKELGPREALAAYPQAVLVG